MPGQCGNQARRGSRIASVAPASDWRISVDAASKALRIERRAGEAWRKAAEFAVAAGACRPAPAPGGDRTAASGTGKLLAVSSPAPPSLAQPAAPFRFSHRQSLSMVFLCTLFGVAAQFLIKTSTSHAMFTASGRLSLTALMTNYPLWAGLTCYGASTLLLILALRDGELSLLYPVISLTYVWVVALSVLASTSRSTRARWSAWG